MWGLKAPLKESHVDALEELNVKEEELFHLKKLLSMANEVNKQKEVELKNVSVLSLSLKILRHQEVKIQTNDNTPIEGLLISNLSNM